MCWALSRCQLLCMGLQQGSCGGRERLCLELEELIQGCSAVPPPLGDNHPKGTQLLVTISRNTPSTAALCKKERAQDNRFIPLPPLHGHQATLCALLGARVWEQPCLGQADEAEIVQTFQHRAAPPARPRSWDELCSSGRLRAAAPGHSPAPRHQGSCCSWQSSGKAWSPRGAPLSLSARQGLLQPRRSCQIPSRPVWSFCSPTNQSLDHGRAQ